MKDYSEDRYIACKTIRAREYADLQDWEGEKWLSITGFPGYAVSNMGRVKSLSRLIWNGRNWYESDEKILIPNILHKGYLQVEFRVDKRRVLRQVHRLVAMMFLQKRNDNYNQVNHIDGNKANNNVSNLEWCNNSMNQKHAYKMGLNKQSGKSGKPKRKVAQLSLDGRLIKVWESVKSCARGFGCERTAFLTKVLKHWKSHNTFHGYKFEYYDELLQRAPIEGDNRI